jgi:hypothetical protein
MSAHILTGSHFCFRVWLFTREIFGDEKLKSEVLKLEVAHRKKNPSGPVREIASGPVKETPPDVPPEGPSAPVGESTLVSKPRFSGGVWDPSLWPDFQKRLKLERDKLKKPKGKKSNYHKMHDELDEREPSVNKSKFFIYAKLNPAERDELFARIYAEKVGSFFPEMSKQESILIFKGGEFRKSIKQWYYVRKARIAVDSLNARYEDYVHIICSAYKANKIPQKKNPSIKVIAGQAHIDIYRETINEGISRPRFTREDIKHCLGEEYLPENYKGTEQEDDVIYDHIFRELECIQDGTKEELRDILNQAVATKLISKDFLENEKTQIWLEAKMQKRRFIKGYRYKQPVCIRSW